MIMWCVEMNKLEIKALIISEIKGLDNKRLAAVLRLVRELNNNETKKKEK